jgi:D-alanyl-D-alanine carboxypeptidase
VGKKKEKIVHVHESDEKVESDLAEKDLEAISKRSFDIIKFLHSKFGLFFFTVFIFSTFLIVLYILDRVTNNEKLHVEHGVSNLEINYRAQKYTTVFELTAKPFISLDDYSSKSMLVFDLNANRTIYAKNAKTPTQIASLTKLISTKVLWDTIELGKGELISEEVSKIEGSALVLKQDQRFLNTDLIKAAIIASSNQGVYAVAKPEETVEKMNDYSEILGSKNSHFANPAGFDDDLNYSTPEDLVNFAKVFFMNKTLADFASTDTAKIFELNEKKTITITNTNDLLKLHTPNVLAGKTGTTGKAGQNLLLLVEKNNRKYFVILLNGKDRYIDAYKVLDRL